jgi:CRISPR-associated protein Cas2
MKTWLVVYDIADPRRLQRVAKWMQKYGLRAQKSVFECQLTEAHSVAMMAGAEKRIDPEVDQIRFYAIPFSVLENQTVYGVERPDWPEMTEVA